MCNIKLSNLSPNLFKEAVSAAKENKVEEKMEFLVNLASEKGFTEDEKKFLAGLASNINLDKLKTGEVPSEGIDFAEPGINFENKTQTANTSTDPSVITDPASPKTTDSAPVTDPNQPSAEPKPQTKMEYFSKIFDENIVNPLKNVKAGVTENIKEYIIESKIKSVESIGQEKIDKIDKKLLNPTDKSTFIKLYKNIDSSTQTQLLALLDGKIPLDSKDSQGKSLIENLEQISNIKKNKMTGESINGKSLLKDAISMLSNDKNITQGAHGTCGAASLENMMRDTQPSELVRIVKDLAGDGKAVLADKNDVSSMKLAKNSLNYKENGRNQFDRIFQSAVMQRVALVGGDERASAIKDGFKSISFLNKKVPREIEYDIEKDDGGPKAVAGGDSAADPYLLTALTNRMLKGKGTYKTNSSYDLLDLAGNDKIRALKKGTIVCYQTEGLTGGRHYVLLLEIKKNPNDKKTYVHFKNTADVNQTTMELNQFLGKLEFTISKKD